MARIILIDDEDAVRSSIGRILKRAGHEVLEASDGEAGLRLLAQAGADLVITDIFMPGLDGIVTVRRMRKEFPQVKVIVVSGGDSTGLLDLRQDAELFGAAATLRKPFDRAELLRTIREILGLDTGGTPSP
jgi:CheY-like chemotaxis protein